MFKTKKLSVMFLSLFSVSAMAVAAGAPTKFVNIKNDTGDSTKFYFEITNTPVGYTIPPAASRALGTLKYPCVFVTHKYDPDGTETTCHLTIPNAESQKIPLDDFSATNFRFAISAGDTHIPQGPCPTTLVEFTLNSNSSDHYDVSLVNGQNYNVKVVSAAGGQTIDLNTTVLDGSAGILKMGGVFPPGCDGCAVSIQPPTGPGCPGHTSKCKSGSQYKPTPVCQYDGQPLSNSYEVTFTKV